LLKIDVERVKDEIEKLKTAKGDAEKDEKQELEKIIKIKQEHLAVAKKLAENEDLKKNPDKNPKQNAEALQKELEALPRYEEYMVVLKQKVDNEVSQAAKKKQ